MPRGQPGTKAPHGTLTRYTRHGCRCDECCAARRDYERAKYGQRPREVYNAERAAQHGTESKYTHSRCRCASCREAANRERARRRLTPSVAVHGSAGYSNGCRCDTCRTAHTEYERQRKRRAKAAA